MEPLPGEITLLLSRWKEGEPGAFEKLVPLVYPHLRKVAASLVRRERGGGDLQATSLVNELCLKLLNQRNAAWDDRTHFYTFSAKVMRMILIDHARETLAQRRGAGVEHIPLHEEIPWVGLGSPELIDLNRALDSLAAIDPPCSCARRMEREFRRWALCYAVCFTANALTFGSGT